MLNNFEKFSFPSIEKRWTKDKETDGQKEKRQEKTKKTKEKKRKREKKKKRKKEKKKKRKKVVSLQSFGELTYLAWVFCGIISSYVYYF